MLALWSCLTRFLLVIQLYSEVFLLLISASLLTQFRSVFIINQCFFACAAIL